jgi:hypothetical protein
MLDLYGSDEYDDAPRRRPPRPRSGLRDWLIWFSRLQYGDELELLIRKATAAGDKLWAMGREMLLDLRLACRGLWAVYPFRVGFKIMAWTLLVLRIFSL